MLTGGRVSLLFLLVVVGTACDAPTLAQEQKPSNIVIRPLEPEASAETRAMVQGLFRRSDAIEFRFTPLQQIEIRGYEPNVEKMRYSYVYRCGPHCEQFAQKLMDRLMTLRRAEGECPWMTAAIIFRDSKNDDVLEQFLIDSTGHCLLIDNRVFILSPSTSLSYFFEAFGDVFK